MSEEWLDVVASRPAEVDETPDLTFAEIFPASYRRLVVQMYAVVGTLRVGGSVQEAAAGRASTSSGEQP
jgi:hypothetical protein